MIFFSKSGRSGVSGALERASGGGHERIITERIVNLCTNWRGNKGPGGGV